MSTVGIEGCLWRVQTVSGRRGLGKLRPGRTDGVKVTLGNRLITDGSCSATRETLEGVESDGIYR